MGGNRSLEAKAFSPSRRGPWLVGILLTAAILIVYGRTARHDFILFDDDVYVYENPHVSTGLSPGNAIWAFTAGHSCNWHPLTWLSHQADCQMFGLKAGGHHVVNVLFHILNTWLLFYFLLRWTRALGPSAFVAALFALHPLHVESVAWVAERKDVLSTFFWLLTMLAYGRYAERPGVGRYLLVTLFLALGLMAKPMVVSLPLVLLLLDYWPLGRLSPIGCTGAGLLGGTLSSPGGMAASSRPCLCPDKKRRHGREDAAMPPGTSARQARISSAKIRLMLEKLPWLAMAVASCVVTQVVHARGGAVKSFEVFPLSMRVGNALLTYVRYLGKMVWPQGLSVFYPYPDHLPLWQVAGAGLAMAGLTVLAIRLRRRYPYILMGWLWYLVTLVPVIGLVQVGLQAMADRYTYIPLTGIFIAIAWGLADFARGGKRRLVYLKAGAALTLVVLTVLTGVHVWRWENSVTLFTHGIKVTKDNELLRCNLGCAFNRAGQVDQSLEQYFAAARIQPNNWELRNTLGVLLSAKGRLDEAIEQYRESLRLSPGHANVHIGLGAALDRQGKHDEAMTQFLAALQIDPRNAVACYNCGVLMVTAKNWESAVDYFNRSLAINPDYADPRVGLVLAFYSQGRFAQAWEQVRESRRCGREPPADLLMALSQRMPEPKD